jgi:hypothetical protein
MRTVSRGVRMLFWTWSLLALVACGGSGGSPTPAQQRASLTYSPASMTFTVGTAITAVAPSVTGSLTNFSVSPVLPAGLSFNPANGTIEGTPSVVAAATNYTVTSAGPNGASASTTLSIAVNDVPPTRVSYGAMSLTFSAGVVSSVLKPTSQGGAVVSWSISPALPQGLDFSTTDGSISGTPAAPVAAAAYVIIARNSGGSGTVTVNITVDSAQFVTLGHQAAVSQVRVTASTALSVDIHNNWILWNYASATLIASGNSGCGINGNYSCSLGGSSQLEVAVNTAVIVIPTGLEVHATSDGRILTTIAASGAWWKLATDGSYLVVGSSTSLTAWSTASGQALFARAGDYSRAIAFAAPGQVLVGAGPAGANVVESVSTANGASTLGPQFNGTFSAWFVDGGNFLTTAGSTDLIYTSAGVQQGAITSVTSALSGQGNWVWSVSQGTMNIYPAAGTTASTSPTTTYTLGGLATPSISGMTVGFFDAASNTASIINFSGAAPARADYTSAVLSHAGAYAAVSAAQWLVGTQSGVLVDGATLGGTVRQFGLGQAWSMAGGTDRFAIATGSGNILYFNSTTLAQEGQIPFYASKIVLSADGTLLVAQGAGSDYGQDTVQVYALPAGTLLYTWSYPSNTIVSAPRADIELSASGAVLGQVQVTNLSSTDTIGTDVLQASAPTGGSQVFSTSFTPTSNLELVAPTLRLSPDGTLIVYSVAGWPVNYLGSGIPGTNLLQNGSLVTAFSGLGIGWLDNSRLLVNNYTSDARLNVSYSGCALYGPDGRNTGGACALPYEVFEFQPITADHIYVPATNQIVSVSTGNIVWASGNPGIWQSPSNQPVSGVTGSRVIFVSGVDLLAQSY